MFVDIACVAAWPERLLPVKLPALFVIEHDDTPIASQNTLVRAPFATDGGTAQISARIFPRYIGFGCVMVFELFTPEEFVLTGLPLGVAERVEAPTAAGVPNGYPRSLQRLSKYEDGTMKERKLVAHGRNPQRFLNVFAALIPDGFKNP